MNLNFTQSTGTSKNNNKEDKNTGLKKKIEKVKVNIVSNWYGKKKNSNSLHQKSNKPSHRNKHNNETTISQLKSFNIYLTSEDKVSSVNDYNEDLPDKIQGTYKYDFNIISVHDLILKRFKHQKDNIIKSHQHKLDIEKNKMNGRQNMVERKSSIRVVSKLKTEIDNIINNKDFTNYVTKILPLIDEYKLLGSISEIVSFVKNKRININKDELPEEPEKQKKRQHIIFDFIEIARKYIQIDLIRETHIKENTCQECGINFELTPCKIDESGTTICSCGIERVLVTRSPYYQNTTRVNNSRSNYEDRKNFNKVMMRYQGKQPDKPPTDLYDALDKYFNEHKLPKININDGDIKFITSEYIRDNILLNNEGEKYGTNRLLMYKALKETNNSNYYDHINLILHIYWKWTLPDISHLEDILMNDYDISQRVYEILPKDRKSSLNSQFRLFKHLRRRNYPCKSKNFKIPTTPDIVEFHEIYWGKICTVLKWENK